MKSAVVSLSGGMDSTTVLAYAIQNGYKCSAVGFTYGSKHNEYENAAAVAVAVHYGVPFDLIDLSNVSQFLSSNLLKSGDAVPEGYYEAENMRKTVVPGRNSIFASVLLGIAESKNADAVFMGIHAGDHFIYPDCRPEWLIAMQDVYKAASVDKVALYAPYLRGTKVNILGYGFQHSVPYHLTRTCYKDQKIACGKCGSCQERLAAFRALGIGDPIDYETREEIPA